MSAPTKKLPTEWATRAASTVELRAIGPRQKKAEAFRMLKQLGFVEAEDSLPWRAAFPQVSDQDLPGICLRGARHKEGLTQEELAQRTGILQRHISEMETGKRPIEKKIALLLGQALRVSYRVFL